MTTAPAPPARGGGVEPVDSSSVVTVGIAILCLVAGLVVGGLLGLAMIVGLGLDTDSMGATIAAFVGLWGGFAAVPLVLVLRGRGRALVADLAPTIRPRDVAWLPLGIAMQFLVAIPYVVWDAVTDASTRERVGDAAEDLVDRAGTIGPAFWLLAVLVVVGAPLVEELVFRCGLQGALLRAGSGRSVWLSRVAPVAISSLLFAAYHAQGLQFAALALVGVAMGLVHLRERRLGPPFFVHMGFNLVAMIQLGLSLADRAS